jgi:hypothetical protein
LGHAFVFVIYAPDTIAIVASAVLDAEVAVLILAITAGID